MLPRSPRGPQSGRRQQSERAQALKFLFFALSFTFLLPGCARTPSQSVYSHAEVGKAVAVSFGTVISHRSVDIVGLNTGTGAAVGGATGAGLGTLAGSAGSGGQIAAIAGGALVGAIAGAMAEQSISDRSGIEYTVVLESGVTLTVAQEIGKADTPIPNGARVIVQNSGGYQRVLPAASLPTEMVRPSGIKLTDPA